MPMIDIKLTETLESKSQELMIKEVSEVVSRIQECPIEAVSINIIQLPLYSMGQGGKSWREIESE